MAILKKIPRTDMDYVRIFAEKLKNNNTLFLQHKKLIDSQIKASRQLISNSFGKGIKFKKKARKYLKQRGY